MKFTDFNFSTNNDTNTLTINNNQIKVRKYLSVSDKNDLVEIALQKAEFNGVYNELLLDVYFHLNIIYLYTDIEFEEQDREDEMVLYDKLESNDVIDKVVAYIGEEEYGVLTDLLNKQKENNIRYKNSAAAVLRSFVTDLPANAAAAKEIVDSFDPSQYQAVVDFAEAANGGRQIAAPVNE